MIIVYWYYYSKFYILGSLFVTYLLNKVTNKLYLPPLIINAFSVVLLYFSGGDRIKNIYMGYLPIVCSSIAMNLVIYLYNYIYKKLKR